MSASVKVLRVCRHCGNLEMVNLTHMNFRRLYSSKTTKKWCSVIGLEVHAQIQADSKLFSGASAKYGGVVNSQVSFLDAALPGTLPVINRKCVEAGVKTALALGCRINRVSKFDRKHYFYADLPAGYQITQQRQAIANGGYVSFVLPKGNSKKNAELKCVRLTQIQLEQDSGKSLHDETDRKSLIDLNRAGCGLMEIISEPELNDGNEARAYVRELQKILQIIGTCDGKMSEGSLRVDANISVHRPGEPLGTRAEVKNLNSVKVVGKAIDFEIQRQICVLEAGGEVVNETRSFDDETDETVPMRDKEIKQDYRFMPEPNLPPLHLYTSDEVDLSKASEVVLIDKLREEIPVLPSELREKLIDKYALSLYEADSIVSGDLLHYFEALVEDRDTRQLTKFLTEQFSPFIQQYVDDMQDCRVTAESIGKLIDLMRDDKISLQTMMDVLSVLVEEPGLDLIKVIDTNNWWQINDEEVLRKLCIAELKKNPSLVAKYQRGKKKVINHFIGNVKNAVDGRGNGQIITQILKQLLSK